MKRYRITVEFEVDRELTSEEIDLLETDMVVQTESLEDGTYEEDYETGPRCAVSSKSAKTQKVY